MNKEQLEQFDKMFTGEKNALLFEMGLLNETAIKQFISQLLAEQRKEIVEKIENEVNKKDEQNSTFSNRNLNFTDGYNQAIRNIIKTLK